MKPPKSNPFRALVAGLALFAASPLLPQAAPPSRSGMAYVPGGMFTMGSPADEAGREPVEKRTETQREVRVSSFFLAHCELTFGEYDAFCRATGRDAPDDGGWGRGDRPVIGVSWDDAVAYCNWRSAREGLRRAYRAGAKETVCDWDADGYRLPTEAEWEFACRAGAATAYSFGGEITLRDANYAGSPPSDGSVAPRRDGRTAPVGSYAPNALGLYDMHGNVWEWCWDWYGKYPAEAQADPRGAAAGDGRVCRGGAWNMDERFLRSAYRARHYQSGLGDNLGFRLARSR